MIRKAKKKTATRARALRQVTRTARTLKKRRAAFLEALAETANVTHACKQALVPRRTAYQWREDVPKFADAWDDAVELGTDALEDEAVRRAHAGVDKPVFYQGEVCGAIREYSDTLLIFMLKARRPDKFKERAEVNHKSDPIRVLLEAIDGKSTGLPNRGNRLNSEAAWRGERQQ